MKGIEHIIKIVLDLRNLNTNMKNMDSVFSLARGGGRWGRGVVRREPYRQGKRSL